MVKKFKLYGIGNYENFNYYIFDKKQEILESLSCIFQKVLETSDILFNSEYKDKKGKWKSKKINYEKRKDCHIFVLGEKTRVDIYLGDKKMFVAIYCPHKLRLKFNLELPLITCMPKPKKFKEKW